MWDVFIVGALGAHGLVGGIFKYGVVGIFYRHLRADSRRYIPPVPLVCLLPSPSPQLWMSHFSYAGCCWRARGASSCSPHGLSDFPSPRFTSFAREVTTGVAAAASAVAFTSVASSELLSTHFRVHRWMDFFAGLCRGSFVYLWMSNYKLEGRKEKGKIHVPWHTTVYSFFKQSTSH